VKGRSARPGGGKTTGAERARTAGNQVPRRARRVPQGASRRSAPFDGSRVGSYSGEVFTGFAAGRSRRSPDVWAHAKRFVSRCITGGATGTTPIRSMANAGEENAPALEREANAKASIKRSHHGVVKTLGARSFVRRGGNSFQGGRRRRKPKESVGARRDLIESERGTSARD